MEKKSSKGLNCQLDQNLVDQYFNDIIKITTSKKSSSSLKCQLIWLDDLKIFKLVKNEQALMLIQEKLGHKHNNEWYVFPEQAVFLCYKQKAQVYVLINDELMELSDICNIIQHIFDKDIKQTLAHDLMGYYTIDNLSAYNFIKKKGFHIVRALSNDQIALIKNNEDCGDKIVKKRRIESDKKEQVNEKKKMKDCDDDSENALKELIFGSKMSIYEVYENNVKYEMKDVSFRMIVKNSQDSFFSMKQLENLEKLIQAKYLFKIALVQGTDIFLYDLDALF